MFPSALSAAINHVLEQEPWARKKLASHAGKIACIDGGIAVVTLRIASDGAVQSAESAAVPDVTIRVKLSELPLMLQQPERMFSYVKVEGDADFANTLSQLSRTLRWEIEEDLSKLVGDIAALRIVSGARNILDIVTSTPRKLAENAAEYLLEEKPVLIRPRMVAEFADEVSRARDAVERIAKRIEKLEGSRR